MPTWQIFKIYQWGNGFSAFRRLSRVIQSQCTWQSQDLDPGRLQPLLSDPLMVSHIWRQGVDFKKLQLPKLLPIVHLFQLQDGGALLTWRDRLSVTLGGEQETKQVVLPRLSGKKNQAPQLCVLPPDFTLLGSLPSPVIIDTALNHSTEVLLGQSNQFLIFF